MNYYKKFINDVFIEWRYRTENGVPNIQNPLHESLLRNILKEKQLDQKVINQVMKSLRELDLVKNKKTGNIYTVQSADKDKHDIVKKNASPQDIKSMTKDDDAASVGSDVDIVPFKKGKMKLNVNGTNININAGKGDKKFRQRIKNLLQNPTFVDNVEMFAELSGTLDEGDMDKSKQIITQLQQKGVQVNLAQIRTGKGIKSNQIRIGTTPFYTFDGYPDTDPQLEQQLQGLEQLGATKQKAGTSDSPDYKPDTFFPNDNANFKFEDDADVRPDLKNSTFHNIGKGNEVSKNVADRIKNIAEKNHERYSSDELKGLQEYADVLNNPNSTKEELQAQYQKLLGSSINRSNQIHKNFGEIHAAIMLSKDYPNSSVLLPAAGNATLSDTVLMHPQGDQTHIVEEVAVKAKGKGVPSSLVSVNSGLVWNEDAKEIEDVTRNIYLNATGKGFKQLKDNPESEESAKIAETCVSVLSNDNVQQVIKERAPYLERLIGRPVNDIPGDLKPHELMMLTTRDQKVFSEIFMTMVAPNVNAEATGKKLSVTEVAENGEVTSHPVIINDLKVAGPKRFGEVATIFLTSG